MTFLNIWPMLVADLLFFFIRFLCIIFLLVFVPVTALQKLCTA
jgi:hypothetical protein